MLDALFAPFPEAEFPQHLEQGRLRGLLQSPLTARVPVASSRFRRYKSLHPTLFVSDDSQEAESLAWKLACLLSTPFPGGPESEVLYTQFWGPVGYDLPEYACSQLGINAVQWVPSTTHVAHSLLGAQSTCMQTLKEGTGFDLT